MKTVGAPRVKLTHLAVCILTAAAAIGLCVSPASAQATAAPATVIPAVNLDRPTITASPSTSFTLAQLAESEGIWATRRAVISSAGSILLANARDARILEIGRDGRVVRSIGREGAGPGEFRFVGEFALIRGDTLLVHDTRLRRIGVFGPNRKFVRTVDAPSLVRCCATNGDYLAGAYVEDSDPSSLETGLADFSVRHLGDGTDDGPPLLRVATRSPMLILQRSSGANGTFSLGGMHRLPLHATPLLAWNGTEVVHADGKSFELRLVRADGRGSRVIRIAMQPEAMPNDVVRAASDSMIAKTPQGKPRSDLADALDDFDWPARLPAIDKLLVDEERAMWVRAYGPSKAGGERWIGITSAGGLIGVLHTPSSTEALAFGHGHVLVRSVDEATGFDRLQMLSIESGK